MSTLSFRRMDEKSNVFHMQPDTYSVRLHYYYSKSD